MDMSKRIITIISFLLFSYWLFAANANLRRGMDSYNSGRFADAIQFINQGLKESSDKTEKVEAYKYLALAYIALGDISSAKESFTELFMLEPEYDLNEEEVSPKVYQLYQQIRKEKQGMITKKQAERLYLEARAWAKKEKYDTALKKIEEAIKLDKESKYEAYQKELQALEKEWAAKKVLEEKIANMLEVEGGTAVVGTGKTRREVEVNTFYMDKTPITNRDYSYFLEEKRRKPPKNWVGGSYPLGKADHPVVHVTYQDAADFCQWKNKRLPTEEEWERAARGPEGLPFPFGITFSRGLCNTSESGIKDTSPVYMHKKCISPYGILDLSGNVWEWTSTMQEGKFILKGGSFDDGADKAVSHYFKKEKSDKKDKDIGFRCVLNLE